MVSIGVGWQQFLALQLAGFFILVTGMCLYNDIIILPTARLIATKLGLMQSEVAEYRDLTEEVDTGDVERKVQITKDDEEEE